MSEYIKKADAVKVAAQILTEVAPVLFPGTIAKEIVEKRMDDLPEAELRSGDRISRCELFNRLATITAEDPNEMKAKIYAVIQEMETEPERRRKERVMTERQREALMRLTMCARNECAMCIYKPKDDRCYDIATTCMHILADALGADDVAEQTEPETDCSWR